MKFRVAAFFSALAVILSLSCSFLDVGRRPSDSGRATSDRSDYPAGDRAKEIFNGDQERRASFRDRTEEVVRDAEILIEDNQEQGAVLDQHWYGLKYFGKHRELILGAEKIKFFGGLEKVVRKQLEDQYARIDPVEENQDPGDIRLFVGAGENSRYDFIVIGQNGREVALKTIIRLLYLARFVDGQTRQKYREKLESFNKSLQVLMSSISPREEFIAFFNKHRISNPDAVLIGFRGDIRSLISEDGGISDPESYADESLRVNWYPDANGKKVLLVSIDKNRIFASRSGEVIEAIFAVSDSRSPPSITFLGTAGAIDAREMVGRIVAPVSGINNGSLRADRSQGAVAHIIRNRAADEAAIKSANVSVESVVVETTAWVRKMKAHGLDTVDQELFHVVNAINSSANAGKVELFAALLVTDNVSSNAGETDMSLEHAEETIVATSGVRREFFAKVLTTLGILKKETGRAPPRRSWSPETRSAALRGQMARLSAGN